MFTDVDVPWGNVGDTMQQSGSCLQRSYDSTIHATCSHREVNEQHASNSRSVDGRIQGVFLQQKARQEIFTVDDRLVQLARERREYF